MLHKKLCKKKKRKRNFLAFISGNTVFETRIIVLLGLSSLVNHPLEPGKREVKGRLKGLGSSYRVVPHWLNGKIRFRTLFPCTVCDNCTGARGIASPRLRSPDAFFENGHELAGGTDEQIWRRWARIIASPVSKSTDWTGHSEMKRICTRTRRRIWYTLPSLERSQLFLFVVERDELCFWVNYPKNAVYTD